MYTNLPPLNPGPTASSHSQTSEQSEVSEAATEGERHLAMSLLSTDQSSIIEPTEGLQANNILNKNNNNMQDGRNSNSHSHNNNTAHGSPVIWGGLPVAANERQQERQEQEQQPRVTYSALKDLLQTGTTTVTTRTTTGTTGAATENGLEIRPSGVAPQAGEVTRGMLGHDGGGIESTYVPLGTFPHLEGLSALDTVKISNSSSSSFANQVRSGDAQQVAVPKNMADTTTTGPGQQQKKVFDENRNTNASVVASRSLLPQMFESPTPSTTVPTHITSTTHSESTLPYDNKTRSLAASDNTSRRHHQQQQQQKSQSLPQHQQYQQQQIPTGRLAPQNEQIQTFQQQQHQHQQQQQLEPDGLKARRTNSKGQVMSDLSIMGQDLIDLGVDMDRPSPQTSASTPPTDPIAPLDKKDGPTTGLESENGQTLLGTIPSPEKQSDDMVTMTMAPSLVEQHVPLKSGAESQSATLDQLKSIRRGEQPRTPDRSLPDSPEVQEIRVPQEVNHFENMTRTAMNSEQHQQQSSHQQSSQHQQQHQQLQHRQLQHQPHSFEDRHAESDRSIFSIHAAAPVPRQVPVSPLGFDPSAMPPPLPHQYPPPHLMLHPHHRQPYMDGSYAAPMGAPPLVVPTVSRASLTSTTTGMTQHGMVPPQQQHPTAAMGNGYHHHATAMHRQTSVQSATSNPVPHAIPQGIPQAIPTTNGGSRSVHSASSGKRKIHLRLVEEVPTPTHNRRSSFLSFRRQKSTKNVLFSPRVEEEPEEQQKISDLDRGRVTISWYEGTTSLELYEHVRSSVNRKLGLQGTTKLSELRILDEGTDPPEEIVLSPYIPDGTRLLLRFSIKDAGGDVTPVGALRRPSYTGGAPESPSAAPSPHASSVDLNGLGLNANQLALLGARLKGLSLPGVDDYNDKPVKPKKTLDSRKLPKTEAGPTSTTKTTEKGNIRYGTGKDGKVDAAKIKEDDDDNQSKESSATMEMRSLHPEDQIQKSLRQITELLLTERTKRVVPRQEKRQVVFVLANYFVLFLSLIAISAEIQARAPKWNAAMEQHLKNVQNCSKNQDALFECVSNGDLAGLVASVVLWISRSAATRRIFLFGFESPQKLWTVVYESMVTALCWGFSYMFIRRGMNPDTSRNVLQKYWKDAVYGSLAGFNAAFMKQVLKNLIPQEAIEDALHDRQLKILSWLPSFA